MRSNLPYLLKAFYEWIVDSDCTPYIAVNAYFPEVEVPQQFVSDGQIVLNIAPQAVSAFEMNDDHLQLSTRFGGVPKDIFIPLGAIQAIYAHENGRGMAFNPEDDPTPNPPRGTAVVSDESAKTAVKSSAKSKYPLRVIK